VSPNRPAVLLDATFLDALTLPEHPEHDRDDRVAEAYAQLLDAYEAHRLRLRARADHLLRRDRRLVAPVERISVADQYRRAAKRLMRTFDTSFSPALRDSFGGSFSVAEDVAVSLVVMRRERITRIGTLHPAFTAFQLELFPAAREAVVPDGSPGASPDGSPDASPGGPPAGPAEPVAPGPDPIV
jgi:hypothetical protein